MQETTLMYQIPKSESGLKRAKRVYQSYHAKLDQYRNVEINGKIIDVTPVMLKTVLCEVADEAGLSFGRTQQIIYTVSKNPKILEYVD